MKHDRRAMSLGMVSNLVIIIEIYPATQSINGLSPLARILHHNGPAFLVVFLDSKSHHRLLAGKTQFLVNLMLDRKTVGIPAEASLDKMALHRPIPGNDVLDRRRQEMAIVGQTRGKRRPIIEGIRFLASRELDLSPEGIDLSPSLEYQLLFLGEVDGHLEASRPLLTVEAGVKRGDFGGVFACPTAGCQKNCGVSAKLRLYNQIR